MHALENITRLRVDQNNRNAKRFSWIHVTMLALGIAGILSVSVSFWIFLKCDTSLFDFPKLRNASARLFHDLDLEASLDSIRARSSLYRSVDLTLCDPSYHDMLSSLPTGIPHVMSEYIFVCSQPDLAETLELDGTVSGSRMIWLLGPSESIVNNQHEYYVFVSILRRLSPAELVAKDSLIWNTTLPINHIPRHEFCIVEKWNFDAFGMILSSGCIPISDRKSGFPLWRFIKWSDFSIIEPNDSVEERIRSVPPSSKELRRSLMTKVLRRLEDLSRSDFILLYIGLS
jgi:hypothetical protein